MALSRIVELRFTMMIERIKGEELESEVAGGSKLGDPPIKFDAEYLKFEFLERVNGNALGFADMLDKPLAQADVTTSMKIEEVAAAIIKKSEIKNEAQYLAKMRERARLGLRSILAKASGKDPEAVLPSEHVRAYVDLDNAEKRNALEAAVNKEFEKYLLNSYPAYRLDALIATVQRRIALYAIA